MTLLNWSEINLLVWRECIDHKTKVARRQIRERKVIHVMRQRAPLQSGEYGKFDEFHECAESPNSSAAVWSAVIFFKKQGWSNRARNMYY